jgi:hypothetical protein
MGNSNDMKGSVTGSVQKETRKRKFNIVNYKRRSYCDIFLEVERKFRLERHLSLIGNVTV